MASLGVSKKVSHVGSWSEDVLSSELLSSVVDKARTNKGTKMKVKVNELGIRLTRTTLLQGREARFFPMKSVQTMEQREEFPRCVVCVLSDPDKKYKVIALRCETDADAVHLTSVFSDIRSKVKSENVELKKMDNGNWTLRGRTDHNANRHMSDLFNEHKQPNGDVAVAVKTDDDILHVPVLDARENHRNNSHQLADVYIRNEKAEIIHDNDDDFVIETEVETHPYVSAEIHADHEGNDVREATRQLEHVSVVDRVDGDQLNARGKHLKHTEMTVLPSKPAVYRSASSGVVSSQSKVYSAPATITVPSDPAVYSASASHSVPSDPAVYNASASHSVPSNAAVYSASTSRSMPSDAAVYSASTSHSMPSDATVYSASTSRSMPSEPVIYSAQRSTPSQPVIYRASSSRAAPSHLYSGSARSYEPTFTTASAGFYTNPWGQRRVSRDSSIIPMRANGSQTTVKFDQQSIMSNTSRLSRSSRLGRSEMSIPSTIQRSIENVYPQPVMVLRRVHGYPPGYRPRPASYHARTNNLRVYYEDDLERGMLL